MNIEVIVAVLSMAFYKLVDYFLIEGYIKPKLAEKSSYYIDLCIKELFKRLDVYIPELLLKPSTDFEKVITDKAEEIISELGVVVDIKDVIEKYKKEFDLFLCNKNING